METDIVPRIILEEREQEVLAKDEMVKVSWKAHFIDSPRLLRCDPEFLPSQLNYRG